MIIKKINKIFKIIFLKNRFTNHILFLLFLIFFSGCARKRPINLTVAKNRVEKYYEHGQYDKDLNKTINRAIRHFKRVPVHKNSTVIFDIDDTTLSDYADEKSISFGYIPKLFHEWVLSADAPAIAQTKRLYDYLIKRGFKIIFLTGRKHNEYYASVKNLKDQGFGYFEKIIVRKKNEDDITAQKYKTAWRKQLIKEGYKIIGNIGDQLSDLNGGYSGYKMKVPNYRYSIP